MYVVYLASRNCSYQCQNILVPLRGVPCTGPAVGPARYLPHCAGEQRGQAARGCQTTAERSAQSQGEERPNTRGKWRTSRAEIIYTPCQSHCITECLCVSSSQQFSSTQAVPYAAASSHCLVTAQLAKVIYVHVSSCSCLVLRSRARYCSASSPPISPHLTSTALRASCTSAGMCLALLQAQRDK